MIYQNKVLDKYKGTFKEEREEIYKLLKKTPKIYPYIAHDNDCIYLTGKPKIKDCKCFTMPKLLKYQQLMQEFDQSMIGYIEDKIKEKL